MNHLKDNMDLLGQWKWRLGSENQDFGNRYWNLNMVLGEG